MEGKEVLGASSPDSPALHIPDPLSITTAALDSDIEKGFAKLIVKLLQFQPFILKNPSIS